MRKFSRRLAKGRAVWYAVPYMEAGEADLPKACFAGAETHTGGGDRGKEAMETDFERGFIRAEVISFDDLMACGTMAAAKEKGLVRSEGKEYVMQDGDIVLFRFNV